MSKSEIRVLIMAGGTGGHVFPALAVADELRGRGIAVEWLGTEKGIEARIVPSANITLNVIDIVGLRGKSIVTWLKMPFLLTRAIWQALKVVKQFSPQVVIGMGGFASGPGALAAKLMGIPLVIHEQNAVAGTTNRWLSKLTNEVLSAFPGVLPKAQCVGNPIRSAIVESQSPDQRQLGRRQPKRLLVLGGSLGAKKINQLVPEMIAKMPVAERPDIRHQTGGLTFEETQSLYNKKGVVADVSAFIDDMSDAYQWADLVICRAGALTVSEISAVGVAAIFIPFPYAIDDHQTKNAEWLVSEGAALMAQEKALDAQTLFDLAKPLLSDSEKLRNLANRARKVAKPRATQDVADICLEKARG
ncbi:undecaprenyldiphospho-muramoylpentapeptide beta-N-acetylglucosaminyltransferase [Aurantivibrio plasticivorans]